MKEGRELAASVVYEGLIGEAPSLSADYHERAQRTVSAWAKPAAVNRPAANRAEPRVFKVMEVSNKEESSNAAMASCKPGV